MFVCVGGREGHAPVCMSAFLPCMHAYGGFRTFRCCARAFSASAAASSSCSSSWRSASVCGASTARGRASSVCVFERVHPRVRVCVFGGRSCPPTAPPAPQAASPAVPPRLPPPHTHARARARAKRRARRTSRSPFGTNTGFMSRRPPPPPSSSSSESVVYSEDCAVARAHVFTCVFACVCVCVGGVLLCA